MSPGRARDMTRLAWLRAMAIFPFSSSHSRWNSSANFSLNRSSWPHLFERDLQLGQVEIPGVAKGVEQLPVEDLGEHLVAGCGCHGQSRRQRSPPGWESVRRCS